MNDMNEVLKVEHLSHVYSAGTPFEKKAVGRKLGYRN